MKITDWKAIVVAGFCVLVMTACSKKLMPIESGTSGGVSEEMERDTGSSSMSSGKGFAGSPGGDSFFSEEPIMEDGFSPDGFSSGGGLGSSMGDGLSSEGRSGLTPPLFSDDGRGGFGSGDGRGSFGMDDEIQESRLRPFRHSSGLTDIHFKFNRYDLDDNSRAVLRENAEHLKQNPSLYIEVQGHCDERGTNNYNIALGERRAMSTKQYLVMQGVSHRKIRVISFGEERPFCLESNEACWYENRRAHFMVSE